MDQERPSPLLASDIVIGKWQDYFDAQRILNTERGDFSIYTSGLQPDVEQPVLILHHGAGYSALSFATFAKRLAEECRSGSSGPDPPSSVAIVAIDARAHGSSSGRVEELSLDCLCRDFVTVVAHLQREWSATHSLFLGGHSLGGAVITFAATGGMLSNVLGLIVIDVVEGTVMRALVGMPRALGERPRSFASVRAAVKWAVDEGISANVESASISIPAQLIDIAEGGALTWKVDLLRCQAHWQGWFQGLSQALVDCQAPRVLVMAQREHLDRTLMIASMQGRFQCTVIHDSGHAIQEDQPASLAKAVWTFIRRNLLVARVNRERALINR